MSFVPATPRFIDTERYRQLTDEIESLSSTDGSLHRANTDRIEALKRERADEAWAFVNPGLTGCWRIVSRGVDLTYGFNAPRFETEANARAYIVDQGFGDCDWIVPTYVVTRAAVEAHNQVVLSPSRQVTIGGEAEAHLAEIVPFPRRDRRPVLAVVIGGAA